MSNPAASPGLYWSIKRSFAAYVARLPDGHFSFENGAELAAGDRLRFPLRDDASQPLAFAFTGAARFSGHFGLLSVRVADPVVTLNPSRADGILSIAVGTARQPLVHFAYQRYSPTARAPIWGRNVTLAAESVDLFGGNYGEGDRFDEFLIIL